MVGANLTPIKIPGKNNRDQRHSAAATNRNKRSRPPGRPPRLLVHNSSRGSTLTSANSGRSSKRRSLKNLKPTRKMANLEKLPTEILTPIFLFSMNLDLPRASPIMAGKLSSRLTILEAITNAFSPTWDYDYEFVKGNSMTRTQVAGDSKLQSAMLRCRCATLSTLKQAEEAWLHRRALERGLVLLIPFHRSSWHRSSRLPHRATVDCWHRYRWNDKATDNCFIEGHRSRWRHKITDDCFIKDYAEFKQLSNEAITDGSSPRRTCRWKWTGFLHMHPDLDIPESLLQGPWTSDMVEYLFWLVRADARIRWTESTSGEVALLGLKNAISTGNLQIFYIFEYLGLALNITLDLVKWAMEHAGGDKLKVIALVLRKFFDRINQGYGPFHLELAGELSKMRLMAQRQNDGSQDKAEAIALVEAIERHWDFLTGGGDNKIVAKGWSI